MIETFRSASDLSNSQIQNGNKVNDVASDGYTMCCRLFCDSDLAHLQAEITVESRLAWIVPHEQCIVFI